MKGEAEGSPNMASSDSSWQKGSVTEESDMLRGRVGNTYELRRSRSKIHIVSHNSGCINETMTIVTIYEMWHTNVAEFILNLQQLQDHTESHI